MQMMVARKDSMADEQFLMAKIYNMRYFIVNQPGGVR